MKMWQFYVIMSGIYLSNHVSETVAVGIAAISAITACFYMYKEINA